MMSTFSNLRISETKILVAVDFGLFKRCVDGNDKILAYGFIGTTCSGLAWAHTEKPRNVSVLQQWPETTSTDEKVPTTLKYDGEIYRWGFQIKDEYDKHEWFKLGLDPVYENSMLATEYPSTTSLAPVYGEACEQLIVDYLTALRKHTDHVLTETIGVRVLRRTPREYIITVPAIWSPKTQDTTRLCAERAGMGARDQIQIISEPEAAGIYALYAMPTLGLKADDTFVICDAGGGTVDLVSYTVAALEPMPLIDEATPGSGKICGSTFLDRIFATHLEAIFEDHPKWDAEFQAIALARFESDTKRNFRGNLAEEHIFPVRGLRNDPRRGIKGGKLTISGEKISDVFEPIIRQIVELVNDQIHATQKRVKAVLLAGGFGRNDYLLARIKEAVGRDIEVRKVINANTAIVRGALLKGLAEASPQHPTIRVDSRKARKHYGTCCYTPFIPVEHDQNKKEWGAFSGRYRVLVMNWFIKKGSSVKESKPQSFPFYYDTKVYSTRLSPIEMVVYTSEVLTNGEPPIYRDNGVLELVKLKADLSGIPKEMLNKELGVDKQMYYKINFEIEMTCHSANISFALMCGGKRYHTVQKHFV